MRKIMTAIDRLISVSVLGVSLGLLLGSSCPTIATTASEYRQRGLALRDQGNYTGAIEPLEKAVQQEPQNLEGRVLLGWTLYKAGQSDRATEELTTVIRSNPFSVTSWNALGIVDLVSGNVQSAIGCHLWAAMLNPQNEIAHYNLSLAYDRLQSSDLAIIHAQKATQLEPENPHPWLALAIAQQQAKHLSEAKQSYQKALQLNPVLGDRAFQILDLQEAGFNPEQIDRVTQLGAS